MFVIMRKIGNDWSIAARDVRASDLSRTLLMWQVRGYETRFFEA